ncbi:hypothetical protein Tco_0106128, partial [Tanacetum coccineum]
WMNKPDFDTMGLDDLYSNFKIVEQNVKKSAGASNDDKNLAFVTTSCASSTNNINTVNPEVSTATTKVNTASTEIYTASIFHLLLLGLIVSTARVLCTASFVRHGTTDAFGSRIELFF